MNEELKSMYLTLKDNGTSPSGKTQKWIVYNHVHNVEIGEIKWYGPWRKYSFFPVNGSVFEGFCLLEIRNMLDLVMRDRKEES